MSTLDMADELRHVAAYIGAVYIPNCEIAQREAVKTIRAAADDLARLRARVGELEAALAFAQKGCGSAVWVANNEHNYKCAGQLGHSLIVSMGVDARRGYDAAEAALSARGGKEGAR